MSKKLTTEEWIEKATLKHNGKYNYSKVKYVNSKIDVIIICPKHGEFTQNPTVHTQGYGCSKCMVEFLSESKIMGLSEFIEKANSKHENKYDYSESIYTGSKNNIRINCPQHGPFDQIAGNHLAGSGCKICGNIAGAYKNRDTKEEFIAKAIIIHGDKYDYSKVNYINSHTDVVIICPIHGEFHMIPHTHLHGAGCQKCSGCYMDSEYFIEISNLKHGNKYDYSKTVYLGSGIDVCITCPIHGDFWQNPRHHMNGSGCKKCHFEKPSVRLSSTKDFIKKSKIMHNNRYTYEKVEYIRSREPVIITCPNHGDFEQTPFGHLQGYGCEECSRESTIKKLTINQDDVIQRFIDKHGSKYDYSKVIYKGLDIPVTIICPEHGEFTQTPHSHWYGAGCPICIESKLETEIRVILENNNISYTYEKRFKWMGKQSLDFYLSDYNIAIECQGQQHFRPLEVFGGVKPYKKAVSLDLNKFNLCKENGLKLFYFANEEPENYLDKIYLDKQELLEEILKYPITQN